MAAGRSQRMGKPKPLLPWMGRTWLDIAVDRMAQAGCTRCVVVVSDPEIACHATVPVVWNDQVELGMLHSIQRVVTVESRSSSLLICPCDMPLLRSETVAAIRSASAPSRVVVPVHGGKPGHPIALGRHFYRKVLGMDPRIGGLDRLLQCEGIARVDVPVEDPGCRKDFDTPEEWHSVMGLLEGDCSRG